MKFVTEAVHVFYALLSRLRAAGEELNVLIRQRIVKMARKKCFKHEHSFEYSILCGNTVLSGKESIFLNDGVEEFFFLFSKKHAIFLRLLRRFYGNLLSL